MEYSRNLRVFRYRSRVDMYGWEVDVSMSADFANGGNKSRIVP